MGAESSVAHSVMVDPANQSHSQINGYIARALPCRTNNVLTDAVLSNPRGPRHCAFRPVDRIRILLK